MDCTINNKNINAVHLPFSTFISVSYDAKMQGICMSLFVNLQLIDLVPELVPSLDIT